MRRLSKNLLDSSIAALVFALGIINNPSVEYRLESFVFLFCNAWELLIKAKLHRDNVKIFYPKKRNKPRRSLSIDDCINKEFTSENNAIKLNIIKLKELRNNAMHLVLPFVPPAIMGLFQASVLNYRNKLYEWFNISLSDRINPGMMALTYDFDPNKVSLEQARVSRKLPKETIDWIQEFQNDLAKTKGELKKGNSDDFHISIDFGLAIIKNPKKADIVLSSGSKAPKTGLVVKVPKNTDLTYPNRQKEILKKFNKAVKGKIKFNSYDVKVIRKVYKIENNPEWFYKSKLPNRSPQYSEKFFIWLLGKTSKDPKFFIKARKEYNKKSS